MSNHKSNTHIFNQVNIWRITKPPENPLINHHQKCYTFCVVLRENFIHATFSNRLILKAQEANNLWGIDIWECFVSIFLTCASVVWVYSSLAVAMVIHNRDDDMCCVLDLENPPQSLVWRLKRWFCSVYKCLQLCIMLFYNHFLPVL